MYVCGASAPGRCVSSFPGVSGHRRLFVWRYAQCVMHMCEIGRFMLGSQQHLIPENSPSGLQMPKIKMEALKEKKMVGRHLYSGSVDRTAKCWLPDTGECVRTYKSHKHSVSTLKYHAGILFTGSGDTCARAFNTRTGALQQVFPGHTFIINCIQIYDNVLYTASHDGTLRFWDIKEICSQTKHQKKTSVRSKLSQKGSLPHLFHNKVGCSPEENDDCEPVELL